MRKSFEADQAITLEKTDTGIYLQKYQSQINVKIFNILIFNIN